MNILWWQKQKKQKKGGIRKMAKKRENKVIPIQEGVSPEAIANATEKKLSVKITIEVKDNVIQPLVIDPLGVITIGNLRNIVDMSISSIHL